MCIRDSIHGAHGADVNPLVIFPIISAFAYSVASKIAIWEYSYLPTVSVMAFVIFDEIPEMAVIIGIGLIIAAGMLSLKSQQLQRALGRVLHR